MIFISKNEILNIGDIDTRNTMITYCYMSTGDMDHQQNKNVINLLPERIYHNMSYHIILFSVRDNLQYIG
jgi:hypothetical protein